MYGVGRVQRDILKGSSNVGAIATARSRRWSHGRALRWTWPPPHDLTDPLRPIAHAAVELLTNGPLEHVKICGNCRWLFLDQSRNHSRRWCSMAECGTQMKQRRFVERRRRSRRTRPGPRAQPRP